MTKDELIQLLSESDEKVSTKNAYDKFQDFIEWQYKKHKGEIDYIFKIYNYKEFQENMKGDIANDFYIYLKNRDKNNYFKNYLEEGNINAILQKIFEQYLFDKKRKMKNWDNYLLRKIKEVIKKSKEINEIRKDREKFYCYKNNRVITYELDIEKLKKRVYLYITKNMNDYEKTITHVLKTAGQCLRMRDIIDCFTHLKNKSTTLNDNSENKNSKNNKYSYNNKEIEMQSDIEKFKKQLSPVELKAFESLENNENYEDICSKLNLSKSTFYRIKSELEDKLKEFLDLA